jgi:RNA polymerase sigma-70 factor (ECF subfamily)
MGAYEGIDGLKSDGQLAPWLYRIARNKSIDHRRKLRIHEPLDDIADEIADDSPAPPDEQTTFDNVESIHRVLDCLSLSHREVLTLFFLQDLSVNAIAQLLAVPPGTVKSRLHHAKRALRTVLGLEREQ